MQLISRKLLVEQPNYDLQFEMLKENRDQEQRMYITGEYIMLNRKNRNNRIYEESEMIPAIETYHRDYITTSRAGGENNHCVPDTYKILTLSGWKQLRDISSNETVATLDIETDEIVYHPIKEKINSFYSGKMIRIEGRGIDCLMTPQHRVLIKTNNGKYTYQLAQDLFKTQTFQPLIDLDKKEIHFDSIIEEHYEGNIGCVTTPNSNWYCMDEAGKCYWTGNSDKPELDLNKLSHRILSLERNKANPDYYVGRSMILRTPSGRTLQTLIEDGMKIGMSSKCLGQIKEDTGGNYVKSPIILGVDAVYDPSVSTAFVDGILENKEYIIGDDGSVREAFAKFEKSIAKYPSKHRDAIQEHILEKFKVLFAELRA